MKKGPKRVPVPEHKFWSAHLKKEIGAYSCIVRRIQPCRLRRQEKRFARVQGKKASRKI